MLTNAEFDRHHIWHPYTSLLKPLRCYEVERCEGALIQLRDGRKLIDGMASWWCAIHGYNHPLLNQAVEEQVQRMSHVMFGGLTHEPAIRLARKLLEISPAGLQRIFFSDSGSIAVEVAIKMALQYWHALGKSRKQHLLTVRNGYHGDTFATMAICDPVNGMHHRFADVLPKHFFVPPPPPGFERSITDKDLAEIETLLSQHRELIAAVILEPIVQGAGGMRFYSPVYLDRLRELCDRHEVLLIFDEIATGFARTGALFATGHTHIEPDILCLGKALTGGMMTLAATLCSDRVAAGIAADASGVLMHGPTFMANPLACHVACASIDLLLSGDWQENIRRIGRELENGLSPCREFSDVVDVRVLGAIGVVELRQAVNMERTTAFFVKQGVWIRPFGSLVYIMPPYICSNTQLQQLCESIRLLLESGACT